jgi:hypothetical protein
LIRIDSDGIEQTKIFSGSHRRNHSCHIYNRLCFGSVFRHGTAVAIGSKKEGGSMSKSKDIKKTEKKKPQKTMKEKKQEKQEKNKNKT